MWLCPDRRFCFSISRTNFLLRLTEFKQLNIMKHWPCCLHATRQSKYKEQPPFVCLLARRKEILSIIISDVRLCFRTRFVSNWLPFPFIYQYELVCVCLHSYVHICICVHGCANCAVYRQAWEQPSTAQLFSGVDNGNGSFFGIGWTKKNVRKNWWTCGPLWHVHGTCGSWKGQFVMHRLSVNKPKVVYIKFCF